MTGPRARAALANAEDRSPTWILSSEGPLADHVEGFSARPEQQEMAEIVAATIEARGVLLCEAGTGTGKTFAYLVPSLLSGRKVILSTGTRALQDQLFYRDLPLVQRALAMPVDAALLKGRVNYLCRYRLGRNAAHGYGGRLAAQLAHVSAWAGRTSIGDIGELGLPDESPLYPFITSTSDNCLGQGCPEVQACHLVRARREAQAAEVVVVNHHLLLADLTLREEGFAELLPGADAVIVDEAHQLPEVAQLFFSTSLGSRQLLELARDTVAAERDEAGDLEGLRRAAVVLEQATGDFAQALGATHRRAVWSEIAAEPRAGAAHTTLGQALADLATALEDGACRGEGLKHCRRRAQALSERLAAVTGADGETDGLCWFESHERGFTLTSTPAHIGEAFSSRIRAGDCAWVFTSATLAVGNDFGYFQGRLALAKARTARWESPYDYARQALLYLPEMTLGPNRPGYTEAVMAATLPVLVASRGRAFLLFTSHRALAEAARWLASRWSFPLLVQGEAPRTELLRRFRTGESSVLLGTQSFWEGVDVRGEALSLVVIDKLPFAAPEDPLTKAQIQRIERDGRNPFLEYQVPEAVIALKQGVGRLIRGPEERGVLMLCDPRVRTRSYGRMFLTALPPMRRTCELSDVQSFFASGASSSTIPRFHQRPNS
ncbi:MAG: ATP-dependent DNA helicase [Gammaproteobacteria bacterium]